MLAACLFKHLAYTSPAYGRSVRLERIAVWRGSPNWCRTGGCAEGSASGSGGFRCDLCTVLLCIQCFCVESNVLS